MNVCHLGGRTALVTGAGQGVGLEIALLLARNGARAIAVNDLFAALGSVTIAPGSVDYQVGQALRRVAGLDLVAFQRMWAVG